MSSRKLGNFTLTEDQSRFLQQIVVPLRLACIDDDGWPLVVSMWYLYEDGKIYCTARQDSNVIEYLRYHPRCAFEVSADHPPYCGLRGKGMATLDSSLGDDILRRLMVRYLGDDERPFARRLMARNKQEEVAVVITPQQAFQWNYTGRMKPGRFEKHQKICP